MVGFRLRRFLKAIVLDPHLNPNARVRFRGVIRLSTTVLVGATFVALTILAMWQAGCGLDDVMARPDPVAAGSDDEYPAGDGLTEDESLADEEEGRDPGVRVYHRNPDDGDGSPFLRSWVDTGTTGVFLVYDAAVPPTEVEAAPRYLAYWRDYETELLYVYQRLLFDWLDVGHSLVNLDHDLAVSLEPITKADASLATAVSEATGAPPDPTQWQPATYVMIVRLMGLEVGGGAETRSDDGVADEYITCIHRPVQPQPPSDGGDVGGATGCGCDTPCCNCPGSCCGGSCCSGSCCSDSCCSGTCCDGTCCMGECCSGSCCDQPCCGGTCCAAGGNCCNGTCCNGPCCEGNCCSAGGSCCNGACCDGPCCEDACCAAGGSCCNGTCCDGPCCEDTCCAAGGSCCNGECCDGPCCEENCCSAGATCCGSACCQPGQECCDGTCCPAGGSCCNEACCDGPCCGDTCCAAGNSCCNEVCCDGPCCGDACCPAGGSCCSGACCDGPCCGDTCCPAGGSCCNGECCDGPCCGDTCCPAGGSCCNGECCDGPCCGDACCPAGGSCCSGACCDGPCCGDTCCSGSQVCCNGTCCDGPCCEGNCCSAGTSCCGSSCCQPGQECCDDAICCPLGESCCGTTCCEPDKCCADTVCCSGSQICCNGSCEEESCTLSGGSATVCPGQSVDLEFSGGGSPECWDMSVQASGYPAYASVSILGGAIPCDSASHTRTVQVSVTEAGELGDFTFDLTSTSPSGQSCAAAATVSVELAAVLTGDPTSIPASTEWDDMPDYSFSEITVTWDPPECEGTLEIVQLEATDGYLPADDGTLTPMEDNCWRYDAFEEPAPVACEEPVTVWIAPMAGDVELDRLSILVLPVHTFLTTGANADFQMDYDYITWKYAAVLATTGGAFTGGVTISTETCVPCPRFPLDPWPPCVAACTTGTSVVFGTDTFAGTENQAASIIGHELVHVALGWGAGECPAYQWESDHRFQTGIYQCDRAYDDTVSDYLFDNMCP